jgi:hypothetical protein
MPAKAFALIKVEVGRPHGVDIEALAYICHSAPAPTPTPTTLTAIEISTDSSWKALTHQ